MEARTRWFDRRFDLGLPAGAMHPRLEQPMTPTDLIFFVAEHDDHHLITITELIRQMSP